MSVFKRLSDILNSNVNAMLDKAENPEKLVRMIISEMEATLSKVRSNSTKTIADKKEMQRQIKHFETEIKQWQKRAELAIEKGRDDLAKQALQEKHRIERAIEAQCKELATLEMSLERLDQDVAKLQNKLDETIARRKTMLARYGTVQATIHLRKQTENKNIDEALNRFARFEKRMDQMEAEVEAVDLGRNVSLSQQIDSLQQDEEINQELDALKAQLKKAS